MRTIRGVYSLVNLFVYWSVWHSLLRPNVLIIKHQTGKITCRYFTHTIFTSKSPRNFISAELLCSMKVWVLCSPSHHHPSQFVVIRTHDDTTTTIGQNWNVNRTKRKNQVCNKTLSWICLVYFNSWTCSGAEALTVIFSEL